MTHQSCQQKNHSIVYYFLFQMSLASHFTRFDELVFPFTAFKTLIDVACGSFLPNPSPLCSVTHPLVSLPLSYIRVDWDYLFNQSSCNYFVNPHILVLDIFKLASIMLLTEPDTPLSNAYHVGSFNYPQIIVLHLSPAGVHLPPGFIVASYHSISKVFAVNCKNFYFSEVCAFHVTNL